MLKYALLGGIVMIAAPAIAQTSATPATQAAGRTPMTATSSQTAPAPATAPMSPTAPAAQAAPVAPQTTDATTAQAAPAAQPATTGSQVAQVVNTEFPTYDKNADGNLDQAEFASWMVALKTASDPSTKADSAATKSWIGSAFAQADKDKSKSVSKTELTGFLSQGQS